MEIFFWYLGTYIMSSSRLFRGERETVYVLAFLAHVFILNLISTFTALAHLQYIMSTSGVTNQAI